MEGVRIPKVISSFPFASDSSCSDGKLAWLARPARAAGVMYQLELCGRPLSLGKLVPCQPRGVGYNASSPQLGPLHHLPRGKTAPS